MGRVINTDSPGKRRNNLMRTSAELIRRLSQKQEIDTDAKNMLALVVYCLRGIDETIDESARAWEKRDYWIKAEEFRERWRWAGNGADELYAIVLQEQWQSLPGLMARLFPNFSDITINKYTRSESLWQGCYARLISEKPS
ncbi:MAG: hypothetical protein RLP44_13790 [Aggregatilineales bacterium]